MAAVVKTIFFICANDYAILVSGKNNVSVEKALSEYLNPVRSWLTDNKLSLHLCKPDSILCGSKQKVNANTNGNGSCDDSLIDSTSSVNPLQNDYLKDFADNNFKFY